MARFRLSSILNIEPKPMENARSLKRIRRPPHCDSWHIILHASRQLEILTADSTETEDAKSDKIAVNAICRDTRTYLVSVELTMDTRVAQLKVVLGSDSLGPS